jgi:hypothetical protein
VHKIGGGVSILEFKGIKNESSLRLVYKPSTVLIDFVIFGDTANFQSYPKNSPYAKLFPEKFRSFADIVNTSLEKKERIQTYMVVPVEDIYDSIENRILNARGYLQYVGSEIKDTELTAGTLNEILEKEYILNIHEDGELNNYLKNIYSEHLFKRINDEKLILNKDEQNLFSFHVGMILMMAWTLNSPDIHFENVIIEGKLPVTIDTENSLSPHFNESIYSDFIGNCEGPFCYDISVLTSVKCEG